MTRVVGEADRAARPLQAYVPQLVTEWLSEHPDRQHLTLEGSMALADISGFTALTERLSRKGKVGAEEMSDILNGTFAALFDAARPDGADLIKWGGDAILLLFRGPHHAAHAARAAHRMRTVLRSVGRTRRPRRVGSRCGCRSASTAAGSISSWSATRRSTAN